MNKILTCAISNFIGRISAVVFAIAKPIRRNATSIAAGKFILSAFVCFNSGLEESAQNAGENQ